MLREITHFFSIYKDLEGKRVEIRGWRDAAFARTKVQEAQAALYRQQEKPRAEAGSAQVSSELATKPRPMSRPGDMGLCFAAERARTASDLPTSASDGCRGLPLDATRQKIGEWSADADQRGEGKRRHACDALVTRGPERKSDQQGGANCRPARRLRSPPAHGTDVSGPARADAERPGRQTPAAAPLRKAPGQWRSAARSVIPRANAHARPQTRTLTHGTPFGSLRLSAAGSRRSSAIA